MPNATPFQLTAAVTTTDGAEHTLTISDDSALTVLHDLRTGQTDSIAWLCDGGLHRILLEDVAEFRVVACPTDPKE